MSLPLSGPGAITCRLVLRFWAAAAPPIHCYDTGSNLFLSQQEPLQTLGDMTEEEEELKQTEEKIATLIAIYWLLLLMDYCVV